MSLAGYVRKAELATEIARALAAEATELARAQAAEALKLAKASNLSDLASAATARTNLGLGSAAVAATGDFDAAGAAAAVAGSYKVLRDRGTQWTALTQLTRFLLPDANAPVASSAAGAGRCAFYLDPAAFAVAGKTTYYRVYASLIANATAPAMNFTAGLYPVGTFAGAGGTVSFTAGTVQTGSTVAFTTPSAGAGVVGDSGDFAAPAAGWFALGVAMSAGMAASSDVVIRTVLQMRQA